MPHYEATSAGVAEAGEKAITSGTREEIESNEEKATSAHISNGPSYTGQGSEEERALIFKQDLRIIPLCSFIYLLCYLDRSNIGNAKVCCLSHSQRWSKTLNLTLAPGFESGRRE